MLQGVNIFEFFDNVEKQRWNNTDVRGFIATLEAGKFPCFAIAQRTLQTPIVAILTNKITGEVVATYFTTIVDSEDGYKVIYFAGHADGDIIDGYYYITLQGDVSEFAFSEVFCIATDLSGLIKFELNSSDITLNAIVQLPYHLINPVFYLPYNGRTMIAENNEEGNEKYFGDIPTFSSVKIKHTIEINGTKHIFRVLSFLKVLCVNGFIEVDDVSIYNPIAESKDDVSFGDSIIINFSFYEYDFIASRNEI